MTYRLKVAKNNMIVCESSWETDSKVNKKAILKEYENRFKDCVISLTAGGN